MINHLVDELLSVKRVVAAMVDALERLRQLAHVDGEHRPRHYLLDLRIDSDVLAATAGLALRVMRVMVMVEREDLLQRLDQRRPALEVRQLRAARRDRLEPTAFGQLPEQVSEADRVYVVTAFNQRAARKRVRRSVRHVAQQYALDAREPRDAVLHNVIWSQLTCAISRNQLFSF